MFKLKINPKKSPSRILIDCGRHIKHGFVSGMQKASIDEIESKFKPYKLPSVRWTNNQISILKYAFEELKRWYD